MTTSPTPDDDAQRRIALHADLATLTTRAVALWSAANTQPAGATFDAVIDGTRGALTDVVQSIDALRCGAYKERPVVVAAAPAEYPAVAVAPIATNLSNAMAGANGYHRLNVADTMIKTLRSHDGGAAAVALCGDTVARYIRWYYSGVDCHARDKQVPRVWIGEDATLFVYGAGTHQQRAATFISVVETLTSFIGAELSPSSPLIAEVTRGGDDGLIKCRLVHKAWECPISVTLTSHERLEGVLDAFDVDARAVALVRLDPAGGARLDVVARGGTAATQPGNDARIRRAHAHLSPSRIVECADMGYWFDDGALPAEYLVEARYGGGAYHDVMQRLRERVARTTVKRLPRDALFALPPDQIVGVLRALEPDVDAFVARDANDLTVKLCAVLGAPRRLHPLCSDANDHRRRCRRKADANVALLARRPIDGGAV